VNYPLGTIAQFVKQGHEFSSGADLLFYGNVPNGAGLSSSASLEIATAVAVNDIYNFNFSQIELVKMGQKAEHEFAGVNCGIMDQFASGMGDVDRAIFLNCDTLEYELVPIKLDGVKIVIGNTNSPHSLSSGKYNERVAECHAAVEALKSHISISQLADISYDEFCALENNIQNETVRSRARHVVSEIERTVKAVDALKSGKLECFGELMNASHDSLRDDYEVTGIELDTMVEEARKIEGVIGSRMTGGGFGGSTVSLVKDDAVDTFIKNVGKNYEARTGIKPEFYVAEIGKGGHKVF
jgi:galactokinase